MVCFHYFVGLCLLGALAIDESVSLAQGLVAGNPNAVSFWRLPQWHSSIAKNVIVKNRRLLEDKVIASHVCLLAIYFFLTKVPRS